MRRALVAALLAALTFTATAQASVPKNWVGMMADGPMLTPAVDVPEQLTSMRASHVGSLRFSIYWSDVEPTKGKPADFSAVDPFIQAAAERGFDLLPVVLRAPAWARQDPKDPASAPSPQGRDAYAAFLTELVQRYGPEGTFWADHPYVRRDPIRRWQIWNEPNGPKFWAQQPGIPAYVELLQAAAPAIRKADPRAQIILAGLFGRAWEPVAQIYGLGGKGLFDAVAVNPFTQKVKNLLLIIRRVRKKMRDNGDAKLPVIATEISYPSAKGKVSQPLGFEVTEKGQASRVRQAFDALANARKKLNITGVFWSTWMTYDASTQSSFDYAGLRRLRHGKVQNKPAFYAFRRVAEQLTAGGRGPSR